MDHFFFFEEAEVDIEIPVPVGSDAGAKLQSCAVMALMILPVGSKWIQRVIGAVDPSIPHVDEDIGSDAGTPSQPLEVEVITVIEEDGLFGAVPIVADFVSNASGILGHVVGGFLEIGEAVDADGLVFCETVFEPEEKADPACVAKEPGQGLAFDAPGAVIGCGVVRGFIGGIRGRMGGVLRGFLSHRARRKEEEKKGYNKEAIHATKVRGKIRGFWDSCNWGELVDSAIVHIETFKNFDLSICLSSFAGSS